MFDIFSNLVGTMDGTRKQHVQCFLHRGKYDLCAKKEAPAHNETQVSIYSSVSDPDPGSVGAVIFSRIRISLKKTESQICQKLFIFEQNSNKF